ncbi:MAG: glutamine--fructose-6-phosphate transaminase (isomerizing), partial [Lutimonas sp.]
MCGIVGAAAKRPVAEILIEGLRRLEYRGYDSAGLAVLQNDRLDVCKEVGKVAVLADSVANAEWLGQCGIAHTRWATHGKPSQRNAHPHTSMNRLALVHNGIIENHEALRRQLQDVGYEFASETDTEVIVHLVDSHMQTGLDLFAAVRASVPELEGAFGLAVISLDEPDQVICARSGSPLVIGIGIGENFIASDQLALRQVTDRFVYLEEGDFARITPKKYDIWNSDGEPVSRDVTWITEAADAADKGHYRHYMLKEIYEQPQVIRNTLQGRLGSDRILEQVLGAEAQQILDRTRAVQIVACGTSYHAAMVAKYW